MAIYSKLPVCALGLVVGVALAGTASAQTMQQPKQQKPAVARSVTPASGVARGADKFPVGPIYFGTEYLGTDPDPFIRLQIQRDIGARFPGNQ